MEKRSSNYTEILILFLWSIYILQFIFFSDFGSQYGTSPGDVFSSKFYTLVTSIFFHGSLFHLLSNSLALFIFGRIVEKHIGFHIVPLFFFGGIVANIFSHLFSYMLGDFFSSWGASGAIASIILLAILMEPFGLVLFVVPIAFLGWLLIYTDLTGIFREDTINQFAHLGGYFATFLLFAFIERKHVNKMKKGLLINILAIIGLYLILLYI